MKDAGLGSHSTAFPTWSACGTHCDPSNTPTGTHHIMRTILITTLQLRWVVYWGQQSETQSETRSETRSEARAETWSEARAETRAEMRSQVLTLYQSDLVIYGKTEKSWCALCKLRNYNKCFFDPLSPRIWTHADKQFISTKFVWESLESLLSILPVLYQFTSEVQVQSCLCHHFYILFIRHHLGA